VKIRTRTLNDLYKFYEKLMLSKNIV
jgi:hypothetical protein